MNKPEIRKFLSWLKRTKEIELVHLPSWLRPTDKGLDTFLDEYEEAEK